METHQKPAWMWGEVRGWLEQAGRKLLNQPLVIRKTQIRASMNHPVKAVLKDRHTESGEWWKSKNKSIHLWRVHHPQNNCKDDSAVTRLPLGAQHLDTHVQKHLCGPYLLPYSKELRVQSLETEVTKPLRGNTSVDICDYGKAMISKIQCPKHQ